MSRFAFVELWFMQRGYGDHLTKKEDDISVGDKTTKKTVAQLGSLFWQLVELKIFAHLCANNLSFKFLTQAKS